jgi:ketosteroid isomerase-like protein
MKPSISLLFLFLTIWAYGQPTSYDNPVQEIIEMEKCFAAAVQSRDSLQTKKYQTDSYFLAYTVEGKPIQIVPKQRWLAVLKDYVTESYSFDDIKVNVYGNTAVAMVLFTQKATVSGQDRSGQFVLTDIWVKGNNGWLITERHSSRPGQAVNMQSK